MRAAMVVGMVAVGLLCGCSEALYRGLDEREANELLASLREAGIEASKRVESGREAKWSIEVPSAQQASSVRHLEAQGLPRRRSQGMAVVLKGGAMVPTPTEERLKEGHLLAEQAVLAIEQLDGVAVARVQLSLPPRSRPGHVSGAAKASVLVKARPGAGPQIEAMRPSIQHLVAGGVDGLAAFDVEVVVQAMNAPPRAAPTREPAPALWLRPALVTSSVLVMVLAAVVVVLLMRGRRGTVTQQQPEPVPDPARPRLTGAQLPRATPSPVAVKGVRP